MTRSLAESSVAPDVIEGALPSSLPEVVQARQRAHRVHAEERCDGVLRARREIVDERPRARPDLFLVRGPARRPGCVVLAPTGGPDGPPPTAELGRVGAKVVRVGAPQQPEAIGSVF